MTEILLWIIIAVFSLLGLSELIHILKQRLLSPKKKPEMRLVVYLDGQTPDLQLISVINEFGWSRAMRNVKLIGVYSDITDETLESCIRISQRHSIELYPLNIAEQINLLSLV